MTRKLAAATLFLALAACGDPETGDRRGYTKAPLEDPSLLVQGENATVMSAMSRPNLPRPPHDIELPEAEEEGTEGGEQEVKLAAGVTQQQFDQGRELFGGQGGCQACHGPNAQGTQLAPNLRDSEWLHVSGPVPAELAEIITAGVPQPREYPAPMPPMGGANLSQEQVQAIAAYIASIAQG